jgi:hypothetical protein
MRDSSNMRIQNKLADAARLNYNLDLAYRLYNKTQLLDGGDEFPLCSYWIGQILKNKEKYADAKKWFVKFQKQDLKKGKYRYYVEKAKIESEACDLALIYKKHPIKDIRMEHLEPVINTKLS